ncbi:MAG: NAD-dependent epimerase/dehydratase family protein [Deltaproteobacteria bacterium]|nr:NAD-dependent epimerase/dehydratase family protein [Deltaproteobacteria bacterium]
MHVLVTGGAGFIGRRLCSALLARGNRVRVIDNFDDAYDPELKHVPEGVELIRGDCCDPAAVRLALDGVDAVAHLAARAGVRESIADPEAYGRNNVGATITLLHAMREAGIRRMVFASSSSVYGAAGGPFRECDPADRPASPYAASKRAAELFCVSSGLDVSACRLFTVYGPGQRPGMAIAKFARAIFANKPVTVYGDGSSLRDYTYVDDAVRGLVAAMDRARGYNVYNIGCGQPIPLTEVLAALSDATRKRLKVNYSAPQPGDVPLTHADITLAREQLGWAPAVSFREGIARYLASL